MIVSVEFVTQSSTSAVRFQIVTVDDDVGILTEPLHQVACSVRRNCWRDDTVFSEYRIDVVALEDGLDLIVGNVPLRQLLAYGAISRGSVCTGKGRLFVSWWIEDGLVPFKRRRSLLRELGILVLA
ncbi:hypothetical protein C474_13959 [Halogeometricum pallidum JCM 14848]|uniref:Uncharacterized protein n=1 Tax=Halogeometricum pallidum JCM 14848 TaxID=1227487 RepID=M0D2X0_HALPD|nr:hypothetical protein C474_13959 [Halogeometricum pallidum JCM 14848]